MEEWNATLTNDYLWTNMIVGEVFPTPTTPSTWSVWQGYFNMLSMGDSATIERIAGRPYLNYSLTYSFLLKLTRKHERVMSVIKDTIGSPPAGVDIPSFPVPWRTVLFQVLPQELRNELKKGQLRKAAPGFLEIVKDRCQQLRLQIEEADESALIILWAEDLLPLWNEVHLLQDKLNEELSGHTRRIKARLTKLVGKDQSSALLTTISSTGELASLGLLLGLSRLHSGQLDREEYLQQYGHRGSRENELAEPRQYEDPHALDEQLLAFSQSPVDVAGLLAKRDAECAAMVGDIKRQLSTKQGQAIERKLNETMDTNTLREATRSELTRLVGVIRAWFLRAGELTGLSDDVFFLTIDEATDLLSGTRLSVSHIPGRREAYEKCQALPPLPTWIRGPFDPFQWAADPNRRQDLFDAHLPTSPHVPSVDRIIRGQPGSAGRVEGLVQRISSPEEGNRLQPGEILVASTTNVGWTPLFPRAAAVVTDIGGSLSHAAIVARELGIPAVVGCGNATFRLKTGDRVIVDGQRGLVQILETP